MRVFLLIAAIAVLIFVAFGLASEHGRGVIARNADEYRQGCADRGFTADQCEWLNRNFKPLWR